MYQRLKLAVVGFAAVALAACSGNGGSVPSPQQPVTQSIGHTGGSMAQAGIDPSKVHIMRTASMPAPSSDAPQTLHYNGGLIERTSTIYVVYWGFNVSGSDPSGEQTYMSAFLKGVGGGGWMNTDHQYYEIVGGVTHHIINEFHHLKGTW